MPLDLNKINADMREEWVEGARNWLDEPFPLPLTPLDQQVHDAFAIASQYHMGLEQAEGVAQYHTFARDTLGVLSKGGLQAAKGVLRSFSRAAKQPRIWEVMALGTAPIDVTGQIDITPPAERPYDDPFEIAARGIDEVIATHPEWETEPPRNVVDLITNPRKLWMALMGAVPETIGAGFLTATGHPIAGTVLIYGAESEQARDDVINAGGSVEDADKAATIYGTVAAALEWWQISKGIALVKGLRNLVLAKTAKRLAARGVEQATKEGVAKTVVQEIFTEMMQGAWQEKTEKMVAGIEQPGGWKAYIDRRLQEATIAFTMTLGVGLGGTTTGLMGSKGKVGADGWTTYQYDSEDEAQTAAERAWALTAGKGKDIEIERRGNTVRIRTGQKGAAAPTAGAAVATVADKEAQLYDQLLARAEEGDEAAWEQLNDLIQRWDQPTYEELVDRALEGDADAVEAIRAGRYRTEASTRPTQAPAPAVRTPSVAAAVAPSPEETEAGPRGPLGPYTQGPEAGRQPTAPTVPATERNRLVNEQIRLYRQWEGMEPGPQQEEIARKIYDIVRQINEADQITDPAQGRGFVPPELSVARAEGQIRAAEEAGTAGAPVRVTTAEKNYLHSIGFPITDILNMDPVRAREIIAIHRRAGHRAGGFARFNFNPEKTTEQKINDMLSDIRRWMGEEEGKPEISVLTRTEPDDPEAPTRERAFVTSLKEVGMAPQEMRAEYHQRNTAALAMKAAALVREDPQGAERMALTGIDDNAVAVAHELVTYYRQQQAQAKDEAAQKIWDEKASNVIHTAAYNLTEHGRASQAAALAGRETVPGILRFAAQTINKYNETHPRRKVPHMSAEQVKMIAAEMEEIQKIPPGRDRMRRFQALLDRIGGLTPTPVMRKIVAFWKAGLVTGPHTHVLNMGANLAHAVTEIAKDVPAVGFDVVQSHFTGKRTVALTLRGLWPGIKEGVDKGFFFLKTGWSERNARVKWDQRVTNFGEGPVARAAQKYVDWTFRFLGGEDQVFYYGALRRSFWDQALAQATNENLTGQAYNQRVRELLDSPTKDMIIRAVWDAETAVFQNKTKLGDIAANLQRASAALEFVVPFGRTPSAVAMQILNYTPVGAAKSIIENFKNYDQRALSQALGRSVIGTGALWLGAMLFRQGLLALDRPETEREKKLWQLEGRQPNSIKIWNPVSGEWEWRKIDVLGPAGSVLIVGGHLIREFDKTGSFSGAIAHALIGGAKSFSEQSFLQGLNKFVEAINNPERSLENFTSTLAGSVVPTIIADLARATDDVERRTTGYGLERIASRFPGARQMLEPMVDVFGQDVPRYGGNILSIMADPMRPSKVRQDIVIDELRRLYDAGHMASPTLLGNRKGYEGLTKAQNTELWRRAGELTYYNVFRLLQSIEYARADDDERTRLINAAVEDAKIFARTEIAYAVLSDTSDQGRPAKYLKLRKSGLIINAVARELEKLP